MASMEELLAEILEAVKESNRELAGISSGGAGSGGEDTKRADGGGGGGGGKGLATLQGLGLAPKLPGLSGIGGVSLGGLGGAAGALAAGVAGEAIGALKSGAGAGLESFLSSGGSSAAAGGGFLRGGAQALGGGFFGEITGINSALAVSDRATGSVQGAVDAAARAGNPLSDGQISGLLSLSTAREERVEAGRRQLGAISDEQFGGVLGRQTEGATDRFSQAVDRLIEALNGKSSL